MGGVGGVNARLSVGCSVPQKRTAPQPGQPCVLIEPPVITSPGAIKDPADDELRRQALWGILVWRRCAAVGHDAPYPAADLFEGETADPSEVWTEDR